jgi:hypothetical protein
MRGWIERACGFALLALGLAIWAQVALWRGRRRRVGAPLDDSYIHFQFARSFAEFQPLEYAPASRACPVRPACCGLRSWRRRCGSAPALRG